jgi:hypothetical protein
MFVVRLADGAAIVLMNRVNKFVRKWKNRHLRDDDDFDGMQKPEFKELSNSIALFQWVDFSHTQHSLPY